MNKHAIKRADDLVTLYRTTGAHLESADEITTDIVADLVQWALANFDGTFEDIVEMVLRGIDHAAHENSDDYEEIA